MKSFFIATLLFFSVTSQAKMVLSCMTEMPTTSYFLSEASGGYELMVYHHNGVDFMPIHDGTVIVQQTQKLVERAEKMKLIGQQAIIRFGKDQCKNEGGVIWRCMSQGDVMLGGLKVKNVGFSMGLLTANYQGFQWKSTETFFHFNLAGENITLKLSFPDQTCRSL